MSLEVLTGKTVSLRKAELTDIDFIYELLNDPELQLNDLSMHGAVSRFSLENDFDKLFNAPDWLRFIIIHIESGERVGVISAHEIRSTIGAFSLSIVIANNYRQKGYGCDAGNQLLSFLFLFRRAERISAAIREYNIGGLSWAKKLNFTQEGRERKGCFANGSFYDIVLFSILSSENISRGGYEWNCGAGQSKFRLGRINQTSKQLQTC